MIYNVVNRTQFEDSFEKGKRKTPITTAAKLYLSLVLTDFSP